jgi:SAM-dependent methyltransferase
LEFGKRALVNDLIADKTIIEVGSLDVNGSLRPIAEALKPKSYIGVDITEGKGVDQICSAEHLISRFGRNRFDVVICTEVLEHVRNWHNVVHNLKQILASSGVLLVTTRSKGHEFHGYPFDFWRYEISDMEHIFSDLDISMLERDSKHPGVFMLAVKPVPFSEKRLDSYELYSMLSGRLSSVASTNAYIPMLHFRKFLKNNRAIYYAKHPSEIPGMLIRRKKGLFAKPK